MIRRRKFDKAIKSDKATKSLLIKQAGKCCLIIINNRGYSRIPSCGNLERNAALCGWRLGRTVVKKECNWVESGKRRVESGMVGLRIEIKGSCLGDERVS